MNIKKGVSLFLCLIMICSTALTPSYATDCNNKPGTPAIINAAEKITGVVVNSFARMLNKIKDTNETNIPAATVFGTYYLGDKPQATDMAVVIRSVG